jgi:hypothetical protein
VRTKHRIFLSAICIACFLLPCLAGQAGEEAGACPKPFIKSIFPWAGKAGYLVTIHGGQFNVPRGEVLFTEGVNSPLDFILAHRVKAEILSWTYHRISVIVPKSVATGPVFVRVHCGAESNTIEFAVNKK